jgi:EAL domain-containing protein (putative c-di-GMP-specific phosphodiesterase class I)
VENANFDPGRLHLEVTESLAIHNLQEVFSRMQRLRRLPIDGLKIDRSFVEVLPGGPGEQAVVRSIVMLAQALGLELIAEGVETEAQRAALQAQGCVK